MRLTDVESQLYNELFRIADTSQEGVIRGPVAAAFLNKSGLSPAILANVSIPFGKC